MRTLVGRAARRRRARRADGPRRAHRRAQRDAADERRRPGRRRVPHRRADAGGLLPRARRARVGDRALARLRAVRRRALVRDLDAGPRRGARVRGRDPRAVPGQAARLQLLAVVQLEARTSTTTRSRRSRTQLGALRLPFQFITLAGFHALNAAMFELARGYRDEGMTAYVRLQEREFELEGDGLHRDPPPARGRRRLLRPRRAGGQLGGESSTLALRGSTEEAQFEPRRRELGAEIAVTAAPRDRGRALAGDALDFVALPPPRAEPAPARAARARGTSGRRRSTRASGPAFLVEPRACARRLARRRGAGRPPRPALRDHRAGRAGR